MIDFILLLLLIMNCWCNNRLSNILSLSSILITFSNYYNTVIYPIINHTPCNPTPAVSATLPQLPPSLFPPAAAVNAKPALNAVHPFKYHSHHLALSKNRFQGSAFNSHSLLRLSILTNPTPTLQRNSIMIITLE